LKEMERPFPLNEKFKTVNNRRLNAIEKEETAEKLFLFSDDKTDKNKKDDCKMASEISQPGDRMIKKRRTPPLIRPFHEC